MGNAVEAEGLVLTVFFCVAQLGLWEAGVPLAEASPIAHCMPFTAWVLH